MTAQDDAIAARHMEAAREIWDAAWHSDDSDDDAPVAVIARALAEAEQREREAIAKMVEGDPPWPAGYQRTDIARAIRARGARP